jgi:succinate dehydrogenase / fumarate reductase iron-sulfur subunit
MIRIAGLEMHPKDSLDRTPLLHGKAGVGMCNITKCCQEVCPEHIHITDNAIIPLKERMADRYFDPIRFINRKALGLGNRDFKEETPVDEVSTGEEHPLTDGRNTDPAPQPRD